MKTTFTLFAAGILLFSACKKDDKTAPITTTTPPVVENTEFSFNVDGSKVVIDSSIAILDTSTSPYDRVTVKAYSAGVLTIELYAWARVQADTIDGDNIDVYYYPSTGNTSFYATSGHVNFTTLDLATNKVAGTFDFIASENLRDVVATKTITNGNLYITNIQVTNGGETEVPSGPIKTEVGPK
jgi:hypothetical protein